MPLSAGGGDLHLLLVGLDLAARNGALNAVNDDPIVGLDPRLDHSQPVIDLPDGDRALLDHVVFVDDQNVAPELARTDRRVGNEQRVTNDRDQFPSRLER